MAITSNRNLDTRNSYVLTFDSFPVSGSTTLYQGQIVGMDSNGLLVNPTDASTVTGVGVAVEKADNGTGANSAINCKVWTQGEIALPTTGSVSYGLAAYVYDNEKVAASGSLITNGVYLGVFKEAHETLSGYRWVQLIHPQKTATPASNR